MYKLSYYTVMAEPIGEPGKKIVYSTRSGKDLIVPDIVLRYIQEKKTDLVPASVLEKLLKAQILVKEDIDELAEIIAENQQAIENESNDILYEVIQPSAMCQMGCYYCGQNHTKNYISNEIEEKIMRRIESKIKVGNYKRLFIAWFGAEPLMGLRQMRELTKKLKLLTVKYNLSYASKVVTNGLSLKKDIFMELVDVLGVNHIEITIDGTREFHDKHRPLKEGTQTFDIILQNLLAITSLDSLRNKCQLSVRCNVDEDNYESVIPLIQYLAKHGLQKKIAFYAIGIYSWGNDAHKKSLTKESFARYEIIWLTEMIKNGFGVSFLRPRSKKVCLAVSRTSEMYDAFGNIFNCTEASYVPTYEGTDYVLGNLSEEILNKPRKFSDWNQTILKNDTLPCHSCEMLPVCGGACPKSWNEDMRACPSTKFNMKERLVLKHLLYSAKKKEDYQNGLAALKLQIES